MSKVRTPFATFFEFTTEKENKKNAQPWFDARAILTWAQPQIKYI
jgi:hypothetical protein